MPRIPQRYLLHNGVATATAIATAVDVSNFTNCIFTIVASSNYAGTIKFQGALRREDTDTSMDFTDGAKASDGTLSNPWMYVEVIDLEDGAAIDGDTGIAFSGVGSIRMVEANINSLDWMGVHVTARTAGTVTVIAHLSTNE